MDYVRFNYVAPPEDGIPPEDLAARIGTFRPVGDPCGAMRRLRAHTTPACRAAKKPALDKWAPEPG